MKKTISTISVALLSLLIVSAPASAQQRSQYLSGMFAVNSGVQPEPGFDYINIFYDSSSPRLKGPTGNGLPVDGDFAVFVDLNVFAYVYKPKILGSHLESIAAIPFANGSLAFTGFDALGKSITGGGGGLANTYFVPVQLGWHTKRVDAQVGYAFFAPTGRYTAGASNNTGVGYWTNAIQAGATIYRMANKATSINAFNIYNWNTQQEGTRITYGQTDAFDYSLLQILPLAKDNKYLLQVGAVGYGQWQTSNPSGPGLLPAGGIVSTTLTNSRFGVNAIGFTANVLAPTRKFSIGTSAFWELGAYNTREGHVLMIQGAFAV